MIRFAGFILAAIFALLSMMHVFWALGGRLGSFSVVPSTNGKPLFTPTTFTTLLVAAALFAAMLVVLGQIGVWGAALPAWFFQTGTLFLALLFFCRAVGEFRYLGFFKRVTDSEFARLDYYLLSPLCLVISITALFIVIYKK